MLDLRDVENYLLSGTEVTFEAQGTSMFPTIFSGDVVTIEPIQKSLESLTPEDIIFVKMKRSYALHRFYEFDGRTLSTKGDNLEFLDQDIECCIGILTQRRKTLKSLLKRLKYWALKIPL